MADLLRCATTKMTSKSASPFTPLRPASSSSSFASSNECRLPIIGRNITALAYHHQPWSSNSPRLIHPLQDGDSQLNHSLYSLTDKQVIGLHPKNKVPNDAWWCGSSCGWLACICPDNSSFFLTDPFARQSVRVRLPWIGTLPNMDFHICSSNNDMYSVDHYITYFVGKIAMSCVPTSPECVIVANQGFIDWPPLFSNISFCKPGDLYWTPLQRKDPSNYEDILYSTESGLFYALILNCDDTRMLGLEIWDLKDTSSPSCSYLDLKIPVISRSDKNLRRKCSIGMRIAESISGHILFVEEYTTRTMDEVDDGVSWPTCDTERFHVYRLDPAKSVLEPVKCIGDEILFIGANEAFSVHASDYPELKSNSIYFTESWRVRDPNMFYWGHDVRAYSLQDNSVSYHNRFHCKLKEDLPRPYWISPNFLAHAHATSTA